MATGLSKPITTYLFSHEGKTTDFRSHRGSAVVGVIKKIPHLDWGVIAEKDRNEAYAISFWDDKADLERYEREVYPQVHEKMADAFVSTPTAHGFEVSNSTWYKIHAA